MRHCPHQHSNTYLLYNLQVVWKRCRQTFCYLYEKDMAQLWPRQGLGLNKKVYNKTPNYIKGLNRYVPFETRHKSLSLERMVYPSLSKYQCCEAVLFGSCRIRTAPSPLPEISSTSLLPNSLRIVNLKNY